MQTLNSNYFRKCETNNEIRIKLRRNHHEKTTVLVTCTVNAL